MGYGIALEVSGDYALFTRPETKSERYSYDIITPSAARAILEAIYWKPQIKWEITKIHVYNEIKFMNIKRNEISSKASLKSSMIKKKNVGDNLYINVNKERQQRNSVILKDVRYVIEAEFKMTGINSTDADTPEKHYNIALRRLRNGQQYYQPYLGCREFPAIVKYVDINSIEKSRLTGEKDFGLMLYDMDFSDKNNISPMFFRAKMKDGVIDVKNALIVR